MSFGHTMGEHSGWWDGILEVSTENPPIEVHDALAGLEPQCAESRREALTNACLHGTTPSTSHETPLARASRSPMTVMGLTDKAASLRSELVDRWSDSRWRLSPWADGGPPLAAQLTARKPKTLLVSVVLPPHSDLERRVGW